MLFDRLKSAEAEVASVIAASDIPEDYAHALDVKARVREFLPGATPSLEFAALAHDIERALPGRRIVRSRFGDYQVFKRAHARNSARVLGDILSAHGVLENLKARILHLVRHHEERDHLDEELSALIDADSVSFFTVNLPHYARRHSQDEVLFRMRWGYRRLSPRGRAFVQQLRYPEIRLNAWLEEVITGEQGRRHGL
ncbi:MAG: DUF4202 family protein [Candidatus Aminicenantales bacterium]